MRRLLLATAIAAATAPLTTEAGWMAFNERAEAVTWRGLARNVCDVLA